MAESVFEAVAMGKHAPGLDTYVVDCRMGPVECFVRVDRMEWVQARLLHL
jgi:Pyruvate/2-oxoacid:ferredoxin oxidoreductase gamma subunit